MAYPTDLQSIFNFSPIFLIVKFCINNTEGKYDPNMYSSESTWPIEIRLRFAFIVHFPAMFLHYWP